MIEELDMATHRPRMSKILTLGSYGAGKTHFIGTAPKPICVFTFDKGYDTIAMQPGIKVISILESTRQRPEAWTQFRDRWKKVLAGEEYVWPDGRRERFRTFALDSLTFLSEMCMNHFQYMGQNVDKKATFTQYQQILENLTDVVNEAKRAAEYVICTALLKMDKDELTGEVLSLPALLGSIRDGIGAQFDAVFYQYTDRKTSGEEVYRMKTVGGYREKAKIRLPADMRAAVAPTIDNPDFTVLLDLVSRQIDLVYGDRPLPPAEPSPAEPITVPTAAVPSPAPGAAVVRPQPVPPRPPARIVAAVRTAVPIKQSQPKE